MSTEDSIVFSFMRHGLFQFSGALLGSFAGASFLPSPSLVLFIDTVLLVLAFVAATTERRRGIRTARGAEDVDAECENGA